MELRKPFPSARDDAENAQRAVSCPQTESPSYRLAFTDIDFMLRDELRPVRLQLEMLKPELLQEEHNIESTVVVFGGSRIAEQAMAREELDRLVAEQNQRPGDETLERQIRRARSVVSKGKYYDEARKLGRIITERAQDPERCELVVVTGGGPGIMEAANRGAHDVGGKSIGLNIVLPHEQEPNRYITPELSFQFHYFAIRKMHFLLRAKALVAFPGGFGTLDELFETLTLVQTKKVKPVPILLFGKEFWTRLIDFDFLVDEGTIAPEDLELFRYVETAEEAFDIITANS